MMRGKISREQLLLIGIGFFVGRAVCFEMNPPIAAFWAAAQLNEAASIGLLISMLLGLLSRGEYQGAIAFLLFVFLFLVARRAFAMRSAKVADGTGRTDKRTESNGQNRLDAPVQDAGAVIRLSVLAAVCLIATQVLTWTLTGATLENGLITMKTGAIRYVWSNQRMTVLALLEAALEGIVTGCLTYLLVEGLSRREWQTFRAGGSNRKLFIAGVIVLATVLYGLPASMYATFAIAESVCYLAILVTAYCYGVMESTLVAAFGGAVLAYQLDDFNVLGLVTLFGVSAGLLRELGRVGVFLGMAFAALLVQFGVDGTSLAANSLKGLVTAGVIFLFLPRGWLRQKREDEAAIMDLLQEQLGRTVREKLRDTAGGFAKMRRGLLHMPQPATTFDDQDISTMYMQMKETVCDQCEGRFRCFHVNPEATYEAAKAVFLTLDEKGALDKEDIPEDFAAVCDHHEAFLIGANQSFERAKANRILEQKLADSRQILADQMGDVARMMSEFGSSLSVDCGRDESVELMLQLKLRLYHVEIRQVLVAKRGHEPDVLYVVARCGEGVLMTAKELSGHIGAVYQRPYRPAAGCKAVITKQFEVYSFVEDTAYRVVKGVRRVAMEEKKNGDNYSYLLLEDGRFVAMLSDGMGTGQCAYEQSATLIELLEEFLEAGWSQEMALKLANSVMALNINSTAYATLDFCSLNLYTGVARLIKIGAAATFIRRGGQVEQVVSTSLPAGVFAKIDCDAVELKLRDGDLVVMLSDGVVDAVIVEEKEAYIKQVLSELSDVSPQVVAEQLIEKIVKTGMSRVKDDMTVLAFLVTKGDYKWSKECLNTSKNSIC